MRIFNLWTLLHYNIYVYLHKLHYKKKTLLLLKKSIGSFWITGTVIWFFHYFTFEQCNFFMALLAYERTSTNRFLFLAKPQTTNYGIYLPLCVRDLMSLLLLLLFRSLFRFFKNKKISAKWISVLIVLQTVLECNWTWFESGIKVATLAQFNRNILEM